MLDILRVCIPPGLPKAKEAPGPDGCDGPYEPSMLSPFEGFQNIEHLSVPGGGCRTFGEGDELGEARNSFPGMNS